MIHLSAKSQIMPSLIPKIHYLNLFYQRLGPKTDPQTANVSSSSFDYGTSDTLNTLKVS